MKQIIRLMATLDIGSNSVRLVVARQRPDSDKLKIIYEKKRSCGLAEGMTRTNPVLSAKGRIATLDFLGKCRKDIEKLQQDLAKETGQRVEVTVIAVATAAVRNVQHTPAGQDFIGQMGRKLGHPIRVISGIDEARLSALGVMQHLPVVNGIVADLGGGSLELALIENGKITAAISIPLGTHTLASESCHRNSIAASLLKKEFAKANWARGAAANLYLVGGTWRATARVLQIKRKAPGRKIHGYRVPANQVLELLDKIAGMSVKDFRNMDRRVRSRAHHVPIAAGALAALTRHIRAKTLVFSGKGLREGLFHAAQLPNCCSDARGQSFCCERPNQAHRVLGRGQARQIALAASP